MKSLEDQEYARYSRQLILPSVGLTGQVALKSARVLVIGAGGLGCPVLAYLAGTGVGRLTVVDNDTVEFSNLHRQILHTESRVGMFKAQSAQLALQEMNSDIVVDAVIETFSPGLFATPSSEVVELGIVPPLGCSSAWSPPFHAIVDCTDNPSTRHFINAYSAAYGIPLASGGAVRAEGTVGTYNLAMEDADGNEITGPCYACVFPPSRPLSELSEEEVALLGTGSCSDEGVLPVLCGLVGVLLVGEVSKILLSSKKRLFDAKKHPLCLYLVSPLSTPVRTIKLRQRMPACKVCSNIQQEWRAFLETRIWTLTAWEPKLCGAGDNVRAGSDSRESVEELREIFQSPSWGDAVAPLSSNTMKGEILIDVRPAAEFGICHLEKSRNVPISLILRQPDRFLDSLNEPSTIHLICRRGNDSYTAAKALRRHLESTGRSHINVRDVDGGLISWRKNVDSSLPEY